jgi:hypothetical protein
MMVTEEICETSGRNSTLTWMISLTDFSIPMIPKLLNIIVLNFLISYVNTIIIMIIIALHPFVWVLAASSSFLILYTVGRTP